MRYSLALIVIAALHLRAQTNTAYGALQGSVKDPSSAAVPGADLTLRRDVAGLSFHAVSGSDGKYRFLTIPPGEYDLEVSKSGFQAAVSKGVRITVGQMAGLDLQLQLGVAQEAVNVTSGTALVETGRSQQANTLPEETIANLPIDRRDYLTFAVLAPGVVDSNTIADNTDLRVKQAPQSGLSFQGSNGRGNSVTVDGSESNDGGGGVRSTLPQEAVQEFQVNRSNYSAEIGGTSGGAVDIVSRSGTNQWHGSAFDYLRNDKLDAGNPFARVLQNGNIVRTKPSAKRNQFGGSLGGPLAKDRTFFFLAFEGLVRRESSVVPLLTNTSIFDPTPAQNQVLNALPAAVAGALRAALTTPQSTRDLFTRNSGVFPFTSDAWRFSLRLDHHAGERNLFFLRHNFSHIDETNSTLQALQGASRGTDIHQFDPSTAAGWTRVFSARAVNELRLQYAYRDFRLSSIEPFGPEIRIAGFGSFNRDYLVPSRSVERRYEVRDDVTLYTGKLTVKMGGQMLARGANTSNDVFFGGRFTFGDLPGSLLNPALPASFTINALQSFNLGLAQTYLQASGNPKVASTQPYWGFYIQNGWQLNPSLKLDLGVRYEIDVRKDPVPTSRKNISPRLGLAWSPGGSKSTVIRAGYGIFYAPVYYQIDYGATALNNFGNTRQISQAFTTIQTPGPAAANNIFTRLRASGVLGVPVPTHTLTPADLAPFGISFPLTGPLPPFSVLFGVTPDFTNPYTQQSSLSLDRQIGRDASFSIGYTYAHTVKLARAHDTNLLPAPVDPRLGIRVWSDTRFFANPLIAQQNIYESTANAVYHALIVEFQKRFGKTLSANVNYTLSKSEDDALDFNSDFEAADQTNLSAERARSSFDQRHKFVAYATWTAPAKIAFSPIFRANSGHPFNLLAGFDLNQDRHDTTDRPVGAPRNAGRGPAFFTVDVRLGREFAFRERTRLRFTAEAFNLLNHQNFATVNNIVGNLAGPFDVTGRNDRAPNQPLGFTSSNDPRRFQLGLRLSF